MTVSVRTETDEERGRKNTEEKGRGKCKSGYYKADDKRRKKRGRKRKEYIWSKSEEVEGWL